MTGVDSEVTTDLEVFLSCHWLILSRSDAWLLTHNVFKMKISALDSQKVLLTGFYFYDFGREKKFIFSSAIDLSSSSKVLS